MNFDACEKATSHYIAMIRLRAIGERDLAVNAAACLFDSLETGACPTFEEMPDKTTPGEWAYRAVARIMVWAHRTK